MVRHGAVIAVGTSLVLLTVALPPRPRLLWNASPSTPVGLYLVAPHAALTTGDTVAAQVPERYRMLATTRRYLPLRVPLVKSVAAVAGDEICARGPLVSVEGRVVAHRRGIDGQGRKMPWWEGCVRLRGQHVLLLSASADAFDGRYFGVTDSADIVGKARLLWAR